MISIERINMRKNRNHKSESPIISLPLPVAIGIVLAAILLGAAAVLAGSTNSPSGPGTSGAQMFTLAQIYDLLDTGTHTDKATTFKEAWSSPGNTMYTKDQVMAEAKNTRCHCECPDCNLVGTRWCDNGDGTVTDLLGNDSTENGNVPGHGRCLVWLENASCDGKDDWNIHVAQSGLLQDPQCGLSDGSRPTDWWLASGGHLRDINRGSESVSPTDMRAFENVRDTYWISLNFFYACRYIFSTDAMDCNDPRTNEYYGWSVRLWKAP